MLRIAKVVYTGGSVARSLRAISLLMLVCLASMNAHAFKVGSLQVTSTLNQPLRAEVVLSNLTLVERRSLRVSVATRGIYTKYNVKLDRAFRRLQLEQERVSDSKVRVVIRGQYPAAAISSTLLLNVVTHQNRLISEHQINFGASTIPLQNQVVIATPVVTSQVAETVVATPGKSLSHLAEKLAVKHRVRRYQVMVALYKANVDKFNRYNMNGLQPGATLKVPARDVILQTSFANARKEIRRHWADWQAGVRYARPEVEFAAPASTALITIDAPVPVAEFRETGDIIESEVSANLVLDTDASIAQEPVSQPIEQPYVADTDVEIVDIPPEEPVTADVEIEAQPYLELRAPTPEATASITEAPLEAAPAVVVSTSSGDEIILSEAEAVAPDVAVAEASPNVEPKSSLAVGPEVGQDLKSENEQYAKRLLELEAALKVQSERFAQLQNSFKLNAENMQAAAPLGVQQGSTGALKNHWLIAMLIMLVGCLSAMVVGLFSRNRYLAKSPAPLQTSVQVPLLDQHDFNDLLEQPAQKNPDQMLMFPEVPQGLLVPVTEEHGAIDLDSDQAKAAMRDLDALITETCEPDHIEPVIALQPPEVSLTPEPSSADDVAGAARKEPTLSIPPLLLPEAHDDVGVEPNSAPVIVAEKTIMDIAIPLQAEAANEEEQQREALNAEQEANVKINLAQIYIELGDTQEASSMLTEVLSLGTVQQIQEAEKMLLFLSR